jgi:succinoglycan biosynthesis protein ExoV
MKLYYHEGIFRNFGDDLNLWLWPRLIGDVINDKNDGLFVGIGTLLNSRVPAHQNVVIFGTGYGYGPLPKPIPKSWHTYCVRGPLTARALGLAPTFAIADGAILLRILDLPKPSTSHPVSFMPHWESANFGAWKEVCRQAGVNYIDPREPLESVLDSIRSSEKLVTGSMHGAIVADAFRVPWIPVRPFAKWHFMKWFDWAGSLEVKIDFESLPASSLDEIIHDRSPKLRNLVRRLKFSPPTPEESTIRLSPIMTKANPWCVGRAVRALSILSTRPGQLSRDNSLNRATSRLVDCLERLRKDYMTGTPTANP